MAGHAVALRSGRLGLGLWAMRPDLTHGQSCCAHGPPHSSFALPHPVRLYLRCALPCGRIYPLYRLQSASWLAISGAGRRGMDSLVKLSDGQLDMALQRTKGHLERWLDLRPDDDNDDVALMLRARLARIQDEQFFRSVMRDYSA